MRFSLTSGGLNPSLAGSSRLSWERLISGPQDPLQPGTSVQPEQVRGWGRRGLEWGEGFGASDSGVREEGLKFQEACVEQLGASARQRAPGARGERSGESGCPKPSAERGAARAGARAGVAGLPGKECMHPVLARSPGTPEAPAGCSAAVRRASRVGAGAREPGGAGQAGEQRSLCSGVPGLPMARSPRGYPGACARLLAPGLAGNSAQVRESE